VTREYSMIHVGRRHVVHDYLRRCRKFSAHRSPVCSCNYIYGV